MKKQITFLLLFMINSFINYSAVAITAANSNITTCSFPSSYTTSGDIVINEGNNADFGLALINTNYTLILTAPANFEFLAGTGSISGGTDITSISIIVTTTTITLTYQSSEANRINEDDILTISGIQIRAITSASSGNILRTAGSPGTGVIAGITNGTTNFGTLSSVVLCVTYPGTSALGRKNWVKSDAGVTIAGGKVSSWADQSGASITGNMNQGTAANRPIKIVGAINYQDYIRFDGVDDGLISQNAVTAVSSGLYSNTDNTIFMVKNIKAGSIVDYKWETDGAGPSRVGFELNGVSQRFDFVDDASGQNNLSTVDITNTNAIIGGVTDASSIDVRINGILDASMTNFGLDLSGAGATTGFLYLGCNDLTDFLLYAEVDIAEEMTFNKKLSAKELLMVESYLAIKYGFTLGSSSSVSDYYSSGDAPVWIGNSTYQNNIIGIGRDNSATGSSLFQKQSHTSDDTVRIYKGALNATNAGNAATFALDRSFVITGANLGKMKASSASNAEIPSPALGSCALVSRLEREWRVSKTNFAETFNMDFKLSAAATPGSVNVADLRLLVDDDGNFANGGTTCYYNGDGTGIVISYSNPTITVSNIANAHIANNTTRFITIGSVNTATPLPIELLYFDAKLNNKKTVDLTWETDSERENDFFTIDKSTDGINWSFLGIIEGAGTTIIPQSYYLEDKSPFIGHNYYRLKQTDFNGNFTYADIKNVEIMPSNDYTITPNPATTSFNVYGINIAKTQIEIFDEIGRKIIFNKNIVSNDHIEINTELLSCGFYSVRFIDGVLQDVQKLVINH